MTYRIALRDVVLKDFESLDSDVQRRTYKQFEKLQRSPELGRELGYKMGVDLSGYHALHFYKNQYRIVYKILENEKEVEVWGIAKRESGRIYQMVSRRIDSSR